MANTPNNDIVQQKAINVEKAKTSKGVKFSAPELQLTLEQFRQTFPNAGVDVERQFLLQRAANNPANRNRSFLADAGTDLSIAFGDRLPQTGGALVGLFGDAVGSEKLSKFGWDVVADQQQDMEQKQALYSDELKANKEKLLAASEARKAEYMADGKMTAGESLSEFAHTVRDYAMNPRAAASEAIQSSESLATMIAGGGIVGAAAKGAAKTAVKKRVGEEVAERFVKSKAGKAAIDKAGQKAASQTGVAYTGISEGAANAVQTRDELNALPDDVLNQSEEFKQYLAEHNGDFDKAKDAFVKSGTARTFLQSGAIAALVGKASGASDAASTALVKSGSKGATREIVESAAKETVEETVQSGTGQAVTNRQVQRGDESRQTLEGVGEAAGAGAVTGGLTGGVITGGTRATQSATNTAAKGANKLATKAAKAIHERQQKLTPEEDSGVTKGKEATTVDSLDKYTAMQGEDLVNNASEIMTAVTTLREQNLSDEDKAKVEEKVSTIKSNLAVATAEVRKRQENAVAKAKSEPDSLSEAEVQDAATQVIKEDGSVDTELAGKLSGSKNATTAQKTLFSTISKPNNPVQKALTNKSAEQVHGDIVEGGAGYTGLVQYVDGIQDAIRLNDQESAAYILTRLERFTKRQALKAKSGKHNGKKMSADLHALVRDEAKGLQIVLNAVQDTASKAFPDIDKIQAMRAENEARKQAERLKPRKEKSKNVHTVPQRQREEFVREALASVLTTEKNIPDVQRKLVKGGFSKKDITELSDALETVEAAKNILKENRTERDNEQLAQARKRLSDGYVKFQRVLGNEGFIAALNEHGQPDEVERILSELPQEAELVTTEPETELRHIAVPERTQEVDSENAFETFEGMKAQIKDFVEQNPNALDAEEGLRAAYDKLQKTTLGFFTENNKAQFNLAVNLLNTLEVPNQEVTTADSSAKAQTTTPLNRVFQNMIEASPIGSILDSFTSVVFKRGLIHTEANLTEKLSDKESGYYNHLTRGLSHEDKQAIDKYARFSTKYHKKLAKTIGERKHETVSKKGETFKNTHNDHLDAFIVDGDFVPELKEALSAAFANWAGANANKSLFNKDSAIGSLLGVANPDDFRPNSEERKLQEAGTAQTYVVEQIGRDAMRIMGLVQNGDTDSAYTKQLVSNLGLAAVAGGLADGTNSALVRQYAHVVRDSKGRTIYVEVTDTHKPSKQANGLGKQKGMTLQAGIPTLKARENRVQMEGEPTRIASILEDAGAMANNAALMRDYLGVEPNFEKAYMDGETMPVHEAGNGIAPKQAEALNKNQEIPYALDENMWNLVQELDPEYREGLVDGLPDVGTEHENNVARNQAVRDDIARDFENVKTMIDQMKEVGSKTVRFLMSPSKKNKRMTMLGSLGNPQNSKLVRHLFKMQNNALTIDPKDADLMLSYKMAVLEALDEKTTQGKGVDKSEDSVMHESFDKVLNNPDFQAAIVALKKEKRTRADIEAIQKVLGRNKQKAKKGTGGTASRLDGLLALAQYNPVGKFDINLFKENDGITNGIAIALLQLSAETSYEEYVNKLARVGIYVDEDTKSFGTFAAQGHKDSYETFATLMQEILNAPESFPYRPWSPLPQLRLFNNISSMFFPIENIRKMEQQTITVTDRHGAKLETPRVYKGALNITNEEHRNMVKGLTYLLTKQDIEQFQQSIIEIERNFAKDPLMIANYGAAIKGLKMSLVNTAMFNVTAKLEQIAQTEGTERELLVQTLEEAVESISIIGDEKVTWGEKDGKPVIVKKEPWVFKVGDDPLKTEVGKNLYNAAAIGVELTYGAALEQAFDIQFGQQRNDVDKLIQTTRGATMIYAALLDKKRKAVMEETGKDYLTVDEMNQIDEELKPHAPYIATALSENRTEDGIWIPKGEKSKDNIDGDYVNEKTDKVKVALNFGSNASAETSTYSTKVLDPSVSAAAVMVQSLDAATQTMSMLRNDLVNVHDASIFNLADSFKGTLEQNEEFAKLMENYSMMDAVSEMFEGVLSHPDVDDALIIEALNPEKSNVAEQMVAHSGNENDVIGGWREVLSTTKQRIQHNKDLLFKGSNVAFNQYSAGDNSAHIHTGENYRTPEDKSASWYTVSDQYNANVEVTPDGRKIVRDTDRGGFWREVSVFESDTYEQQQQAREDAANEQPDYTEVEETYEHYSDVPVEPEVDYTSEHGSEYDIEAVVHFYGLKKDGERDKRVSDEAYALKEELETRLKEGQYYEQAKAEMVSRDKGTRKLFKSLERKMKLAQRGSTNGRSQRSAEKLQELEINKNNARTIFNSLAGVGAVKPDAETSEALSEVLGIIEPHLSAINLSIFGENAETHGNVESSGINLVINTGAKVSGIEMSPQEVLVHELAHVFLMNSDKNSRAYREIVKMYRQARKELKPEDFLGDIENPTQADLDAAKERYDHTVHNSYSGSTTYRTYLGEEKNWHNADPAEEFAVMALTNPQLRAALRKTELRLNQKKDGWVNKIKAAIEWLFNKFTKDLSMNGMKADKRIVRMAEHIQGSLNQKRALVYRATAIMDTPLDAASDWIHGHIDTYKSRIDAGYELLKDTDTVKDAKAKLDDFVKAAKSTDFAKSKLVHAIHNEFRTGRRSLAELARLIAKSSYMIERKSQFFVETITKEMNKLIDDATEQERISLYRLLESDAEVLLDTHSAQDTYDLLTDEHKRKVRISKLVRELQKVAPTASRYMAAHAKDLGYHTVTGQRLHADGMYTNAYQIAHMWGYDGKAGTIDTTKAQKIVDELSSLHALNFAKIDGDMQRVFGSNISRMETLLAYQRQTKEIALETTFKDNEYNYRKGYIKEEFENRVDIVVAKIGERSRLESLGYTMQEGAIADPDVQGVKQYYFVKENGELTKYLTGAVSTAAPHKRGTDLFKISGSDTEVNRLLATAEMDKLLAAKQARQRKTFGGKPVLLKGQYRSHISQPVFDSEGNVTSYRYVAANHVKNKVHGRKQDFAHAIGATFASVSRRVETTNINQELMDYFYQTYIDEKDKNPEGFVNMATDPDYAEQYNLLPKEAKDYAHSLFGSNKLMVKRSQVDIAFGYRKFSVAGLQHDKHPKATALREVLRHTNNLAALMFNNRLGITVETYWQAFVATAKDTLVIKSGVVTAANIASNLTLLWMSGISPAQATKDHAEAYTATWKYLQDQEKEFSLKIQLDRTDLSDKERKEIQSEVAFYHQELINNPVRTLMEAGMYSAIVDDVDVGENTLATKDWLEKKLEPLEKRTPELVKTVAKNFMLTHDTKAYKVMRDMAQISDFAARYSLHKHNLENGMKFEDSIRDVRTTFVDYDMPSHKALQYVNDMGLMGFTKYFFRIQQVIAKRFAENPARLTFFAMMNSMLGLGIASPLDALFGMDGLNNRFYGVDDWVDFSTMTAPINLMTK